jgi:hypothetical protein
LFALFPLGRRPRTMVVATVDDFDCQFGQHCDSARRYFDAQNEALHGDLDMELTSKLEEFFSTKIGPWEAEAADWWHNMDYYGDGVRGLSFVWDRFPVQSLPFMHENLGGRFQRFSVHISFYDGPLMESPLLGRLWMDSENLLITRSIAERLACAT